MIKKFGRFIALFVVAFLLGAALTLSMASPAYACQLGTCFDEPYGGCDPGSPCPGERCLRFWSSNAGSGHDYHCCGTITGYNCL